MEWPPSHPPAVAKAVEHMPECMSETVHYMLELARREGIRDERIIDLQLSLDYGSKDGRSLTSCPVRVALTHRGSYTHPHPPTAVVVGLRCYPTHT